MNLFETYFFILFLLYVWFETDAPQEYAQIFRINLLKFKEYQVEKRENPLVAALSHHNYLLLRHNTFWTRLLTCPVCLGVWFNLLAFCFRPYMGVMIIATWVGYAGLVKLLKKLNE